MKWNPFSLGVPLLVFALQDVSHGALASVNLTAAGSSNALSAAYLIGNTLADTFAYNPNNPTATSPARGDGSSIPGFHGDSTTNHFLQYTFAPIATGSGQTTQFVVDLWGRSTIVNRDDNYTITLYNGDFSTIVGSTSALTSIPTANPQYQRTVFNLDPGMTFDRFEIHATNTQYFTIAETRAAFETVPEPSAAFLAGVGALMLWRRRRG